MLRASLSKMCFSRIMSSSCVLFAVVLCSRGVEASISAVFFLLFKALRNRKVGEGSDVSLSNIFSSAL